MCKLKIRKWVLPFLALLMVSSLILGGCGTKGGLKESAGTNSSLPQATEKEPYKIGLLTTLSGPTGYLGVDVRDTSQMEVDLINAAGGINGHPLELVIEDDGMDPGKAVSGFTKLVRQDKVLAVTGEAVGLTETALRPVAEHEKVPFVMLYPSIPETRARKDKYGFNIAPNELSTAAAWIDILKAKGYMRVAAIGATDSVSPVSLNELKKEAAVQGITIDILSDTIDGNAVDVIPQVTKLKQLVVNQKSQAVVSTVWPPNLPPLLNTMKQIGLDMPVIAHMWAADNPLLNMGGDELNDLIMPGFKVIADEALPDSDPQKTVIVNFNKRYKAKFGRVAGLYAATSFDSIHLIANALKVAGADRAKLRDELEKTTNYVGVTGVLNYSTDDHDGVSKDSLAIYEIKDKKFVFLRVVTGK